jgi:predicted porin
MNKQTLMRGAAVAALTTAAGAAQAISFTQNDWTLDINGTVNGFYTFTDCSSKVGASQWNAFSACNVVGNGGKTSSVENGFLPVWLNFVATARLNNLDIKAHIGFAPGTSNPSIIAGQRIAGAESVGDVRNAYLTFGDASWGTIKAGRDAALFERQATFSDLTVPGVGTQAQSSGALNTTFGQVGEGYVFMAFQPQITYTSPTLAGFQGAVGIFQPIDIGSQYTGRKQPMLQGLATYDLGVPSGVNGQVWTSFLTQKAENLATGATVTANGYELGGKVSAAGITANLSGFTGKGIGDAVLFLNATDAAGNKYRTQGFLGNVSFNPIASTKLGLQYGETRNKDIAGAKNKAYVLGIYHDLAPGLKLVGEYIDHKTEQTGSPHARAKTIAVGANVFF